MVECEFCGKEFDSEKELHRHWDEHEDEINSHQKEKMKKAKREHEEQKETKVAKRKQYAGYGLAGIAVLALVGFVGAQLLGGGNQQSSSFNLDEQPMLGQENASVTVVVFEDFYCPACQTWNTEVKPVLRENYISTGTAKLYYIDFPLGIHEPQASAASEAAECAYRQDEDEFWKFHDSLYQNQRNFDYDTEGLISVARDSTSGLDYEELRSCISSGETSQAVDRDLQIARSNNVRSTPTVFVNGEEVTPSPGWTNIRVAIEQELEQSQNETSGS